MVCYSSTKSILIVDCRFVRFLELNECLSAVRRINEKIFKGNKIIVQLDSSSLWKMKG
jgi:hypothetical protein